MIQVRRIDDTTFEVSLGGRVSTSHRVTVDPVYHAKLTGSSVPPETLVEKSFEFLLEREPNTSILSQFNLSEINRYFPEYEARIREILK